MSVIDKLLPDTGRESRVPQVASADDALKFLAGLMRRRSPVILRTIVFASALGMVYVLATPPSFTARAVMVMDSRRVQLFQPQQPIFDDTQVAIDSPTVDSYVEILKSENVLVPVIKKLRLTENPEFVGNGGVTGWLLSRFGDNSEFVLMRSALRALEDSLEVKRVRLTNVIEIGFRSRDPQLAADVANEIASSYVDDQLDGKYRRASIWFQDRLGELRERASAAERAVVEFKAKNAIVDAGGRLMNEQQLAELSTALTAARAHVSETRARLDRIQSITVADPQNAPVDATVADTMNSAVVSNLRTRYFELANREANLSARYGRNHMAVVNLRDQMREIRNSMLDELRRYAETYKSDFEIAKRREEEIQKRLALTVEDAQQTGQAQVTLRDLESAARSYRALYDAFLQRSVESIQQQSFPISEARLITPASRPLHKSHPRTLLCLAGAAFAGSVLGLGVAVVRDRFPRGLEKFL